MKHLLFIEDDSLYADMITRRIKTLGDGVPIVKVQTLTDGLANAADAMAIILDLTLPDSDVDGTIDSIRTLSRLSPVWVLTGKVDGISLNSNLLKRCMAAGASHACFKTDLTGDVVDFFLLMLLQMIQQREANG